MREAVKDGATVRLGGDHIFKGGVNVDFSKYDVIKQNSENPRFVYESWYHNFEFPQRVEFQAGDPRLNTNNTQLGLYLQDQMKVGEKVSIVLGARRDDRRLAGEHLVELQVSSVVREFAGEVREALDVHHDGNAHLRA